MKTTKGIDDGFNHIKTWLDKKLKDRAMSVDRFCVASGSVLNPTTIRRWYSDDCRPYPKTMKVVCETLSHLPVILEDGTKYMERVQWSEGLSMYSPKPRAWLAHYANRPTSK